MGTYPASSGVVMADQLGKYWTSPEERGFGWKRLSPWALGGTGETLASSCVGAEVSPVAGVVRDQAVKQPPDEGIRPLLS